MPEPQLTSTFPISTSKIFALTPSRPPKKRSKPCSYFAVSYFPFVQDLAELVTVLQQSGQQVSLSIAEAARLTRFAVETRYPSLAEAVTREDYDWAVAIAAEVIRWVERNMSGK